MCYYNAMHEEHKGSKVAGLIKSTKVSISALLSIHKLYLSDTCCFYLVVRSVDSMS